MISVVHPPSSLLTTKIQLHLKKYDIKALSLSNIEITRLVGKKPHQVSVCKKLYCLCFGSKPLLYYRFKLTLLGLLL